MKCKVCNRDIDDEQPKKLEWFYEMSAAGYKDDAMNLMGMHLCSECGIQIEYDAREETGSPAQWFTGSDEFKTRYRTWSIQLAQRILTERKEETQIFHLTMDQITECLHSNPLVPQMDPDYCLQTDMEKPIIMIEVPKYTGATHRIIDGWHRLLGHYLREIECPFVVMTEEEADRCLVRDTIVLPRWAESNIQWDEFDWCEPCQSHHMKPRDEHHHETLKCRANFFAKPKNAVLNIQ